MYVVNFQKPMFFFQPCVVYMCIMICRFGFNITMHTADLFQKEKRPRARCFLTVQNLPLSLSLKVSPSKVSLALQVRLTCTVLSLSHSQRFRNIRKVKLPETIQELLFLSEVVLFSINSVFTKQSTKSNPHR